MDKVHITKADLVVLVDEADKPVGTMEKKKVHNAHTPLHRGLSVFLFNHPSSKASDWLREGTVLVQRRALQKLTWPGVWSNSCCGHPQPGEKYTDAARRVVKTELGLEVEGLIKVSDYRYTFERNGVVENEICPIFMGKSVGKVELKPDEVMDYKWMGWQELLAEMEQDKAGKWSEWCKEEAQLVDRLLG